MHITSHNSSVVIIKYRYLKVIPMTFSTSESKMNQMLIERSRYKIQACEIHQWLWRYASLTRADTRKLDYSGLCSKGLKCCHHTNCLCEVNSRTLKQMKSWPPRSNSDKFVWQSRRLFLTVLKCRILWV